MIIKVMEATYEFTFAFCQQWEEKMHMHAQSQNFNNLDYLFASGRALTAMTITRHFKQL